MTITALRTVLADVAIDLSARRGRALLLLVAVALSCGVLIASTAATLSAARQIDTDLAAASTSLITVAGRAPDPNALEQQLTFPADTEQRAGRIDLVHSAGRRFDVATSDAEPSRLAHGPALSDVEVLGVTSGYLAAAGITEIPTTAWLLDDLEKPYAVAYLGRQAAERLGIPNGPLRPGVRIWIAGAPVEVLATITSSPDVSLDNAILLPYEHARGMRDSQDWTAQLLIRTHPGAGAPVAGVIREAIRPDNPGALTVSAVSDFRDVRVGVDDQLARLALGIGLLLLALTALLIANAMVVSVVARTPEIGLRRALGASSPSVAAVFLTEGALVGLLGGLAGSALGIAASVTISATNDWSHHFPPALTLAGPALGLAIGITASTYPAIRAAHIAPSEALRAD